LYPKDPSKSGERRFRVQTGDPEPPRRLRAWLGSPGFAESSGGFNRAQLDP